jgi:ankyrin repeat protein
MSRADALRAIRVVAAVAAAALWTALAAAATEPALIAAVRGQDLARVDSLLAEATDVEVAAADGSTPLLVAVELENVALAERLVKAGADVTAGNTHRVTPLALAARAGHAELIDLLLAHGASIEERSGEGQTALMLAARNGRLEAVELLLARGADVDAIEPFRGQTALMWAAGAGNAEAARALLARDADVDARSLAGFTALLFAVRNAELEALRVLIEHGADVDAVAPDGTSALGMAVVNAYYEVASVLLEHGANPNAPDPRGSALHTLAWLRKPGATGNAAVGGEAEAAPVPVGRVTSLALAEQLLVHGANPNVRVAWEEFRFSPVGGLARNPPDLVLGRHLLTYVGATPFYIAAKNGDVQLMRVLAAGGADATLPNRIGVTPLMVASGLDYWEGETPGPHVGVSEAERLEAVKLAVELGNDVNARADFGDFPMTGEPAHTLLYYPHNMDELVNLGVGDPRWDGCTALHGSVIANQPSITRYLIEQGAEVEARNDLGWTPLMMSRGVFLANASREFPAIEAVLLEALGGADPG